MSAYHPDAPVEDVNRGTVVALLAIPVGVIAWVLIWSFGFIASIISFGVAYIAMFLYRLGSGGAIGRAGAVRVTIITLATLALSIFAGLVWSVATDIGQITHTSTIFALTDPSFWERFQDSMANAGGALWGNIGLAALFGILGCFGVLRSAFSAAAAQPQEFGAPLYPSLAQPNPDQGQAFQGYGTHYPSPPVPAPAPYNPEQYEPQQPLGQAVPGVPQFPSQVQPSADGTPQPGVQYPNPPGYQPEGGEQR